MNMKTRICPKTCVYRDKRALVCGYCLQIILKELKEEKEAGKHGQAESKDAEQAE